jgi:hypothetical protein
MLDPSGLREILFVLQLMRGNYLPPVIEENEAGAGSSLVDRAYILFISHIRVLLPLFYCDGNICGNIVAPKISPVKKTFFLITN